MLFAAYRKLFCSRIFNIKRSQEREYYISKLKTRLIKIYRKYEKDLYYINFYFDKESRVLQEIWEVMSLCVSSTLSLFDNPGKKNFCTHKNSLNKFYDVLIKYEAFDSNSYINDFLDVYNLCSLLGCLYKRL